MKILMWVYRILNILVISGLLLSILAPFVNPQFFWPLAFFGLSFTLWLVAAICLFMVGLFIRNKQLLYTTLALVVCWPMFGRSWAYNNRKTIETPDFKIASFNASSFGHDRKNAEDVYQILADQEIDVAIFIEWRRGVGKVKSDQFAYHKEIKHGVNTGVQIVSKYRILRAQKIKLPNSYSDAAWADLVVKGDTIRMYMLHLESNQLTPTDYHKIKDLNLDPIYKEHAQGMASRIRMAMKKRAEQVKIVRAHIQESPYPVFVCGDMNDTPQSFAYQTIQHGLEDAFISAGNGWDGTFVKPFPFLRIDYILFDPRFECTDYGSKYQHFSDHKLIFAGFKHKND